MKQSYSHNRVINFSTTGCLTRKRTTLITDLLVHGYDILVDKVPS